MCKKVYIVTDLGPGDGGKGSIIHFLARKVQADIVIKRGGAQGSHGVRTADGRSFNFSQWGCGTLDGIPTYCSKQLVLMPVGLDNEAKALRELGIDEPFALISADPKCICATPFHRLSSQIEELLRKDAPRGTIGTGVGQAYRMARGLGSDFTIYAEDLTNRRLVHWKLLRQAVHYRKGYESIKADDVKAEDVKLLKENLNLLDDDGYVDYIADLFERVGKQLRLQELPDVLKASKTAIVECSHGVLTDAEVGLRPHVSAIRTLPQFSEEMLRKAGYDGEIIHLAVHRAYEIRHGAGPMPTYDPDYTKIMLPDSHKADNRWQGSVRIGALDATLMRYALDVCGDTCFHGLCLTWFDQILKTDRNWRICDDYTNWCNPQDDYVEFLKNEANPNIKQIAVETGISQAEIFSIVDEVIFQELGISLSILSLGPTEQDKVCSPYYVL